MTTDKTFNETRTENQTNNRYPENFESRHELWKECKDSCFNGRCVAVNGYYNCSDLDHNCAPQFKCKNGVCLKSITSNSESFKCLCEYGYIGTFCEKKCFRDCGIHGDCIITDKNTHATDCVCNQGYTGQYCTVKAKTKIGMYILYIHCKYDD